MELIDLRPCFLFLLFLLMSILGVVSSVDGHIADFDEVWQERAKKAQEDALAAYHPNPEEVTGHLNHEVKLSLSRNESRRQLAVNRGKCVATNPIDQCWRCKQDWESNRKRLADCVVGFGRNTTGGKDGDIYVVYDSSDDDLVSPKKGTLRHAVIQDEPLWIIFSRSMMIRLSEELMVNSNKTIDGRGHQVHIHNGAGITIQFVKNVIIHGLHIHDIKAGGGGMIRDSPTHFGLRTRSDGDGISIFGSSNVWVDHVSMANCMDGMIDAIEMSTAITVSNCHFTNHNEALLFGANDHSANDTVMQITLAFNHFGRGLVQRLPRCRFGFCHVVNNHYSRWLMYAVGGSAHPTILSQGNRFNAPNLRFSKEVTKRDFGEESEWKHWQWRSEGDLFMNGAFFVESGPPFNKKAGSPKDMLTAFSASAVVRLTQFGGALHCVKGKAC
ncbi:Pectate lyase/Amb allergen [Cinnamomum micranthum f. kanehirae]|uniref:Pectate lyase n=1 Tax=Cinnamomum micranthum f. kanehirae TaxID=337451 RepID=A0A443PB31_9MAGN|nr:Pectate lyase/Amb allergen [Cinnamomum micranthum f. kanehirae]